MLNRKIAIIIIFIFFCISLICNKLANSTLLRGGIIFFQYLSRFISPYQFTMSLGKDVFLTQITQDFFDKIFIFLKIDSINGLPI